MNANNIMNRGQLKNRIKEFRGLHNINRGNPLYIHLNSNTESLQQNIERVMDIYDINRFIQRTNPPSIQPINIPPLEEYGETFDVFQDLTTVYNVRINTHVVREHSERVERDGSRTESAHNVEYEQVLKYKTGTRPTDEDIDDYVNEYYAEGGEGHYHISGEIIDVDIDDVNITEVVVTEDQLTSIPMFKTFINIYDEDISKWKDTGVGMCVYEWLLYRYRNTMKKLTKEKLLACFQESLLDMTLEYADGVTTEMIKHFCIVNRIPMYAVDIDRKIYCKHKPKKRNKHHPVLAFKMSNNHMYPIEDKKVINSLAERSKETIKFSKLKKPNYEIKFEEDAHFIEVESLYDDVISYIGKYNELPYMKMYNDKVTKFKGTGGTFYANLNYNEIVKNCDILGYTFKNQGRAGLATEMFKNLYPQHKRSVFNMESLKIIKGFNKKKGGYVRTFVDSCVIKEGLKQYDIIKCYTNAYLTNKYKYCVFKIGDEFENYNGILELGYYIIKCEDDFFKHKIDNQMVTYSCIKQLDERNIKYQILYKMKSTCSLKSTYFVPLMNEFRKLKNWKYYANIFNGCRNRFYSTSMNSKFTIDRKEAEIKFSTDPNIFINSFKVNDLRIYEIQRERFNDYIDFDAPIYTQIIENGWFQVYDLYKKVGGKVIKIKTDAVLVENPNSITLGDNIGDYQEEKVQEKEIEELKITPLYYKDKFKLIKSKWKVDIYENDFMFKGDGIPKDIVNTINDFVGIPFTTIVNYILNLKKGINIDGRYGVGKSTMIRMIKEQLDRRGLKYHVMSPTNKAARNIGGETIHHGLSISRDGTTTTKSLDEKCRVDYIIIDEISMIYSNLYAHLMAMKRRHHKIKFIMVGDFRQLKPVGDDCNYKESAILKYLCDYNRIELTINKRSDQKMDKLLEQVEKCNTVNWKQFDFKICKTNICLSNKMRQKINYICMKKYCSVEPLFIEQDDERFKRETQDTWLVKGTPLIAVRNCKDLDLYNNEDFAVVGWNNNELRVINIVTRIVIHIPIDMFHYYFDVAYCTTIYKCQGQTYDKPYAIHEYDHFYFTKEYKVTALSRTTDMKYIKRGLKSLSFKMLPDQFIKRKINGYEKQDLDKHRECDLTVIDFKKIINKGFHQCYCCGMHLHCGNLTLNRIDNSIGHNYNNCVLSCLKCNISKKLEKCETGYDV